MAGHRFVIDHAAQAEFGHPVQAAGILKCPRPGAVGRRTVVVGGGVDLAEAGKRPRDDRRLRPHIEQQRGPLLGVADDAIDIAHDLGSALLRSRVRVTQVNAEFRDAFLHRAFGATDPPQNSVHFLFELVYALQANLMNLLWRQACRRVAPQVVRIRVGSSFEPRQSRFVCRDRDLRLEQRDGLLPCRVHLRTHDVFSLATQLLAPSIWNGFERLHLLGEDRHERIFGRRRAREALHLFDGRLKNKARRDDSLACETA